MLLRDAQGRVFRFDLEGQLRQVNIRFVRLENGQEARIELLNEPIWLNKEKPPAAKGNKGIKMKMELTPQDLVTLENARMVLRVQKLTMAIRDVKRAQLNHPVCRQSKVVLLWRDEWDEMLDQCEILEHDIAVILSSKPHPTPPAPPPTARGEGGN